MKVKDLIKMLADFPEDAEVFVSVDFDSALDLDGARVFGKLMSDINPHHDEVYLLAHADSGLPLSVMKLLISLNEKAEKYDELVAHREDKEL